MANEVQIDITVEEKQALAALTMLSRGVDKTAKKAKKSFSIMDSAVASFAGNVSARAVSAGFRGIANGLGSLVNASKQVVAAAAIQEDAINELNRALKSSGQFTEEASKDFQQFASTIQKNSKFGDEVILQNAALIQSLGGLETEGLKRATNAAIELSAGLGIDLRAAALLVGKAATGEVSSFSRYGISIKKAGSNAETFEKVLESLESKFGGAALAQIKTFSGASEQLGNVFGDVQESFGFIITESPIVVAALKGMTNGFLILGKFVDENKDEIRTFAEEILTGTLVGGIQMASDAIIGFSSAIKGVQNFLSFLADLSLATAQSILEMSQKTIQASVSIKKFFGLSTEGSEEFSKSLGKQIETIKQARLAGEREVAEREMSHHELANTVTTLNDKIVGSINKEIDAARESATAAKESNDQKIASATETNEALAALQKTADEAALERQALIDVTTLERFEKERIMLEEKYGSEQAMLIQHQVRMEELKNGADAADIKRRELIAKADTKAIKDKQKRDRDAYFTTKKWDDLSSKQKVENLKTTLGTISTLQSSGNKELFAVGKAAALAKHAINVPTAISTAMASAPPPFNFVLAGLVGAAMAIQGAKIASAKPSGFAAGGVVGGFSGASVGGDNSIATVRTGEMILNAQQQRDLFESIKNVNSDVGEDRGRVLQIEVPVMINEREIARAVRNQKLEGFAV